MAVKCTHHCRACGRHFHSLAAFDGHFERASEDAPAGCCLVPGLDDRALQYVGYKGICDIAGAVADADATVWELSRLRKSVESRAVA